jgi:UPF0755 protein
MKRFMLLGIGFVAIVLFALGVWFMSMFRPVAAGEAETVSFVVPKGQAVTIIGNRLAEAGLIRNPLAFRIVVKERGLTNKLQAGTFEIDASMTPGEIAQKMTQGTNDLWVTIPEGWRREEIAESLAEQLPEFDAEEFLSLSAGDEGKLFPDTYLVARESTAQTLYSILTNTFESKILNGLADDIDAAEHEFDDVLIMASIVEREARGYEEMRHVAGILWNRIELGMPLQADATLQYVKGYNKQTKAWWEPPLAADKQLDSPFNTYKNPGLPPRPISNPGYDAIRATLNPVETDDVFYLHDRDGGIHYAESLEEHNANVQRYLR